MGDIGPRRGLTVITLRDHARARRDHSGAETIPRGRPVFGPALREICSEGAYRPARNEYLGMHSYAPQALSVDIDRCLSIDTPRASRPTVNAE